MTAWKVYYPEDGETAEDAVEIRPLLGLRNFVFPQDAAERACGYDFNERDGWERERESRFLIVVIDPKGVEHVFTGWHESSVEHRVWRR
jgi:hypothetical protein